MEGDVLAQGDEIAVREHETECWEVGRIALLRVGRTGLLVPPRKPGPGHRVRCRLKDVGLALSLPRPRVPPGPTFWLESVSRTILRA